MRLQSIGGRGGRVEAAEEGQAEAVDERRGATGGGVTVDEPLLEGSAAEETIRWRDPLF